MPEECDVHVSLGYSPIYDDESKPYGDNAKNLRRVLGNFVSIRFQVVRTGDEFFEVTIHKVMHSPLGPQAVSERVGGRVDDLLNLPNGESLRIWWSPSEGTIKLHFWRKDDYVAPGSLVDRIA